ncbi:MAG: BspA family leucine-rich repeat surface protein [Cyclobacteriaceae bacterium]|nr:BspA family leucine-rich repeat surface protein [Cyclobacteriaceae bacterium]
MVVLFAFSNSVNAQAFITTWQTTDGQITIPTTGGGYNYSIIWTNQTNAGVGDGSVSGVNGNYTISGLNNGDIYQVEINGSFPRINFNNGGDKDKILTVEQWGDIIWTSMETAFYGCTNLTVPAVDSPNLSVALSLNQMFHGATSFNQSIDHWDVSNIVIFYGMFWDATSFNQPLNSWVLTSATDISSMFQGATSFNQPLNNWTITTVNTIQVIFKNATSFNQPVNSWDVSNVTNFAGAFQGASSFNQPLANWELGSALTLGLMFYNASSFNQPIGNWNVSGVTNMSYLFGFASNFNQDLGGWNISSVTDMTDMLWLSGLSTANYDKALIGWATLDVGETQIPTGIASFRANGMTYCNGETARQDLISSYGWAITLDTKSCNPFITTWQTTDGQITIPTTGGGYSYDVVWTNLTNAGVGDGSLTGRTGNTTISGLTNGDTYQVEITGAFPRIYFNGAGDFNKILTVEQWGSIAWTSMSHAFDQCHNLVINATDAPNLFNATDLSFMFFGNWNMTGNLSNWDVSTITNMSYMFNFANVFNGDVSSWDVSNVTDMKYMFAGALAFNQPLAAWGTKTGNVLDMAAMFYEATSFNQDISNWDVSNVTFMYSMFEAAYVFNQPLNSWNVSNVVDFDYMFNQAYVFNQPLNNWNLSSATDIFGMFGYAYAFNQDLSSWSFPLVTDLYGMFDNASSFNQDLSGWDISNITDMTSMLSGSGLSPSNYDATLIGWAAQSVQAAVTLDADNLYFCSATAAKATLVASSWAITDAGQYCPFTTTWKTDNPGVSGSNEIEIPIYGAGTNMTVFWEENGNPTNSGVVTSLGENPTITFPSSGTYTIEIVGTYPHIQFNNSADRQKITSIDQWGFNVWDDFSYAFNGCTELTVAASDIPDLSNVSSAYYMFSEVKDFTSDLSGWDVSNITNMSNMFAYTNINQDLNSWNVSNVADMSYMFRDATAFNGNISTWTTTSLSFITAMFYNASAFDGDISGFDVSGVSSFAFVFRGATAFKQNINGWNVSGGTVFDGMFQDATSFNQNLNSWNVSSATSMTAMFRGATAFNGNISSWNVSSVSGMSFMFYDASNFDSNISGWQVGNVATMANMFVNAIAFNQDISSWDVSKVQNMGGMFFNASSFDQNLGSWNIGLVTSLSNMLDDSGLSLANYDATLIGWEAQVPPSGLSLGANGLTYCDGTVARSNLISSYGWTISGDAQLCPYVVTNTNDSGTGSLRWCMDNAIAIVGKETITFNIPISDPNYDGATERWTISPASDLPLITFASGGAVIDASTQPGSADYRVILDGQGTLTHGLSLQGPSEVYGLWITNFTGGGIYYGGFQNGPAIFGTSGKGNLLNNNNYGIYLFNSSNITIQSNLIGTDPSGTVATPNNIGIYAQGNGIGFPYVQGYIIGGSLATESNIISGNTNEGILLWYNNGALIEGNWIGVDASGNAPLPNNVGISHSIGINATISNNVISSNTTNGLHLSRAENNNLFGNNIGVGSDGTTSLGNGIGVYFEPTGSANLNNAIGGTSAGEANIVANNSTYGIQISNGYGNSVIANSIYCNGTLGISLNGTANNSIQPPYVSGMTSSSVSGVGTIGENIHVFRANSGCYPSQGQEYLGTAIVDGSGNWSVTGLTIDTSNDAITATASNATDGTSEFTPVFLNPPGHSLDFDGINDYVDAGGDASLYGHSSLTIEAWVKLDYSVVNDQYVIAATIGSFGTSGGYEMLINSSGQPFLMFRDDTHADQVLTGTTVLADNTWYHLAGVIENAGASTNSYIYVNGGLDTSTTFASVPNYDGVSNLFIGSNYDGEPVLNFNTREFSGEIDELRIWDDVRTQTEIQNNISNSLAGNEANLIAYYKLDQGIANGDNTTPPVILLPDRTTNNNDGALNNFALNNSESNWIISNALQTLSPEIDVYHGSDNSGIPITDAQITPIDFGSMVQGTDITQTFAIENTGTTDLDISGISVSGTDFSVTNSITTISFGATQTFTITLSGTSIGTFSSTVTITNNDSNENPFTFDITGTITATPEPEINVYAGLDNSGTPIVDAQATAIDFGSAFQGTDITQTFAIENTGTADLNVSNITVIGTDYTVNNSITTISIGTSQTFTITLSGTNTGIFNTTVTIENDDSNENPFTFDITGVISAVPVPEINVYSGSDNSGTPIADAQATAIDFGSAIQGADITQTFAIENTGTADLNVSGITISGTDYSVSSSIAAVPAGNTQTFTVTLSGTNAGTFNTTVTIANDDSNENPFTFDITGVIAPINAPEINVYAGSDNSGVSITNAQATPFDLGSAAQGTDVTQTFAIENTGTSFLAISGISVSGSGYSVASTLSTIPMGATETFTITLSGANTGTFNGTVSINNDDADENPFTFEIAGSIESIIIIDGEDNSGEVVISNQTIDLGSTTVDVNIDKVFVIENPSTTNTLTITNITSDNPAFEIIDPPASVPPAGFDQFVVRLLATSAGDYSGNVLVSTNLNDFTFSVSGEVLQESSGDIKVYNVVTPNGDGVHDFLKIENITSYPDNKVIIYNRWGDKVFEATGYDNQSVIFDGTDNTGSNQELETGNFYYSIDKGNGEKALTGFIFLKR